MGYEDVDEITRQAACENVKKIVNAIKLIRIKYYPNFASISEEDERTFRELNTTLEIVTSENNLHYLKDALMKDVSAKYERNDKNGQPITSDNMLLACYGAIDAGMQALSEGKIKQAIKCQRILEEYLEQIENEKYKELVTKYKREKFGELIRDREDVENINKTWNSNLKDFCKPELTEARKDISELISKMRTKGQNVTKEKEEVAIK